ncbi:hypothetical protein OXB_2963 [Bacillus sp. OxB-1]|uniref:hypothetical protein n=1 Tax=Bacillus sp. (strain OxB-1) TaxID=98228 RepID=UPI000581C8BA|nr:hypothetical protein [Bacillus sp. OxB-1]BAQ11433.1 hypothetical protein OXB_2963 [Bacillus sp. OxB-1]
MAVGKVNVGSNFKEVEKLVTIDAPTVSSGLQIVDDGEFIYGIDNSKAFKKFSKGDSSVIFSALATGLGTNTAMNLAVNSNHVVITTSANPPTIQIYNKSDFSLVGSMASGAVTNAAITSLAIDEESIFVWDNNHTNSGGYLRKYDIATRKANGSVLVQNLGYDIHLDDTYVYAKNSNHTITKFLKSNLSSVVEGDIIGYRFTMDDEYLYANQSRTIYKASKNDLKVISQRLISELNNTNYETTTDDEHLYVVCTDSTSNRALAKLKKKNFEFVSVSEPVDNFATTLIADKNYLYVAQAYTTRFLKMSKVLYLKK